MSTSDNFAISPNQRFIIVGDIWLSNRSDLIHKLKIDIDVNYNLTNQQIISYLWEKYNSECLTLLLGMFKIINWDIKKQELYLIRDTIGSQTLYLTKIIILLN